MDGLPAPMRLHAERASDICYLVVAHDPPPPSSSPSGDGDDSKSAEGSDESELVELASTVRGVAAGQHRFSNGLVQQNPRLRKKRSAAKSAISRAVTNKKKKKKKKNKNKKKSPPGPDHHALSEWLQSEACLPMPWLHDSGEGAL